MTDLELRIQAVQLWGNSTVTLAQAAQDCIKSIEKNFGAYKDMPSVSGEVRDATGRLETALVALYEVEAALGRIVDTRMAEEENRP